MKYLHKHNAQFKPSFSLRAFDEEPVQNGLSMTPSQMMELVNRGVPISNSNLQVLEVYKTGDKDFEVPMEFRRNADMSDMWQHREEVRGKVRSASDEYLSNLKQKQQVKEE